VATYQIVDEATVSAIIQNVAAMVSFPVPTDPAGDTDPAAQQFLQALNMSGAELLALYDWQELIKTYEISIVADSSGQTEKAFALPVDFFDWIDQTNWNATTQLPSIGPVSPQMWQALLIRTTLPTLSFYWQVRGNYLYVLAPPATSQTMKFFYSSNAWVQDQDNPTLYKNRATKNGDVALLDANLMTLFTRVKWLEMKGLDSSAAMRDFQVAFENRKGAEKGSPVLSMVRDFRFPYLNALVNTPDTGYGV
tara:strand:- start:7 stop:759 length:753 start_codon:yes stop_codon:yes gene_type:complete